MPNPPETDGTALPAARDPAGAGGLDAQHLNRNLLRWARFVMAAMCSFAICTLLAVFYFLDLMSGLVAVTGAGLILGSVLVFFVAFRWRLNLRAADPSLTVPMAMVSVLCLLYVMQGADIARDTFVSFFGLILLFGVFRHSTRTLILHAGLMLAGYGIVIFLSWHDRPQGAGLIVDVARWLTLATVLPLFTLIGGQMMAGRRAAMRKLRDSEERFRRLTALSSDWYWEQDSNLRFTTLSPGLEAKAGIAPTRLIGKTLPEVAAVAGRASWEAYSEASTAACRLPISNASRPTIAACSGG